MDFSCDVKNATGRDLRAPAIDFSMYAADGRILGSEALFGDGGAFPAGATRRFAGGLLAAGPVPDGYSHACVAEARSCRVGRQPKLIVM